LQLGSRLRFIGGVNDALHLYRRPGSIIAFFQDFSAHDDRNILRRLNSRGLIILAFEVGSIINRQRILKHARDDFPIDAAFSLPPGHANGCFKNTSVSQVPGNHQQFEVKRPLFDDEPGNNRLQDMTFKQFQSDLRVGDIEIEEKTDQLLYPQE